MANFNVMNSPVAPVSNIARTLITSVLPFARRKPLRMANCCVPTFFANRDTMNVVVMWCSSFRTDSFTAAACCWFVFADVIAVVATSVAAILFANAMSLVFVDFFPFSDGFNGRTCSCLLLFASAGFTRFLTSRLQPPTHLLYLSLDFGNSV